MVSLQACWDYAKMLRKLDRAVGLNIFPILSFQWKYAKYLKILRYAKWTYICRIFLKSLHLEFTVKTILKLNRDPLFKGRYIFLNDSNRNSISNWNHEPRRKVKYTGKVCRGIIAVHIFSHTQLHTTWENRF